MDAETLGAALALVKNKILPKTTPEDAGATIVVGSDGKLTAGSPVEASISVNGTTLEVVTNGNS